MMMFRSARRRRVGLGIVAAIGATALAATSLQSTAGAYPGAPWFRPSTVYTDLSGPERANGNFPDPSVIVVDGTAYAYGSPTGGAYLPVMTSTDMVSWTARPAYRLPGRDRNDPFFNDAFPNPATWSPDRGSGNLSKEVWAPGVAKVGARYVAFYAARVRLDRDRFCISVATSDSPIGPFDDNSAGPLVCDVQGDPNGSIDPQPLVDADGTAYLIWKSEGVPGSKPTRIWSQRLDAAGTAFAAGTAPTELLGTSAAWEGNVIENPSMVRYNDRWLLFYSANEWNSANYAIGYADCDGPLGPCRKRSNGKPLLGSDGQHLGPGGASAFVAPDGSLKLAYHYWLAPFVGYPKNSNCDGNGQCTSQGQRRMWIDAVTLAGDQLSVGGRAAVGDTPAAAPAPPKKGGKKAPKPKKPKKKKEF
jgi:beta-xylosidase